jgi:hypothetical protein
LRVRAGGYHRSGQRQGDGGAADDCGWNEHLRAPLSEHLMQLM